MVITSDNEGKAVSYIFICFINNVSLINICNYFPKIDDEMTRPTFAERKRLGRELFDSDSSSSTSEPTIHSSTDEEESSNDSSSDEDSCDGFVWQNKLKKLCKTMTMEDFDRVR